MEFVVDESGEDVVLYRRSNRWRHLKPRVCSRWQLLGSRVSSGVRRGGGLQFQEQISSGHLPCGREEASLLAAIQMSIEENWPVNVRTQPLQRHLIKGQFGRARALAEQIMIAPWDADSSVYCTPPRNRNPVLSVLGALDPKRLGVELPGSPGPSRLLPGTSGALPLSELSPRGLSSTRGLSGSLRRSLRGSMPSCVSSSEGSGLLHPELQARCLPAEWRGDRKTLRLVRESKRKLFHSQLYESERQMKQLYIQTCKRLPAYGSKVFPVKEILHGSTTLKKNVRLLCLSSQWVSILDAGSKTRLKAAETAHLAQWRVGGGLNKHQLDLEFAVTNRSNPQDRAKLRISVTAPSYSVLKSISMALWEIQQCRSRPSLTGLQPILGDARNRNTSITSTQDRKTHELFGLSLWQRKADRAARGDKERLELDPAGGEGRRGKERLLNQSGSMRIPH